MALFLLKESFIELYKGWVIFGCIKPGISSGCHCTGDSFTFFLGNEPSSHLRYHFFQQASLKKRKKRKKKKKADLIKVMSWVTLSNAG